MMFKSIYTTEMSAKGKMLKRRFVQIKAKRPSKAAKGICGMLSAGLIISAFMASGALADTALKANTIEVTYRDSVVDLKNKPYEKDGEVFLPLRETLENSGVPSENITWENGVVTAWIYSSTAGDYIPVEITQGQQGVRFSIDSMDWIIDGRKSYSHFKNYSDGIRTTIHASENHDGVMYVPMGMLVRIKNCDAPCDQRINYETRTLTNAEYLKMLDGLEVKKYDNDGKFDYLLWDWYIPEENKLSPEAYYEKGEHVFIGNEQAQNEYTYEFDEINGGYTVPRNPVKRILTDDNGQVMAVVPIENQRHEMLNRSLYTSTIHDGTSFTSAGSGIVIVPIEAREIYSTDSIGVTRWNNRYVETFFIPTDLFVQKFSD